MSGGGAGGPSLAPDESSPAPSASPRTALVVALGLGVAVGLAYATSFSAGFTLDSQFIIQRAARVHAATWPNLVEIFTTDYWAPERATGVYRPLATLSYLFNWAVLGNGARATGYHVVNLLLEWGNALLLYAVCRRALALAVPGAFFTALLFAVHPVATEVVTNIVGRADLLSAASVLGGLLLYVAAARAPTLRRRALLLSAVAGVTFLGLLSKENAVVLVGVAGLWDVLFRLRRRAGGGDSGTAEDESSAEGVPRQLWRFACTGWIAFAPPLLAVWLVRSRVLRATPPAAINVGENILAYVDGATARLTALAAFARSFGLLVWPSRLCPDYSVNEIPLFEWRLASRTDFHALLAALGIGLAIVLAVRLRRRAPAASFFLAFYLITILPTANLILPLTTVMAERLLYLPLVGFCGCLVLAVLALAERISGARDRSAADSSRERRRAGAARIAACAALALIAFAWGARTSRRNQDWRDDRSLWTAAAEDCPGSFRSHEGLSAVLANPLDQGDSPDLARAIAEEELALAILEQNSPPGVSPPPQTLERLGLLYYRQAQAEAPAGGPPSATAARAARLLERAIAGYLELRQVAEEAGAQPQANAPPKAVLFDYLGLAELRAGDAARATQALHEAVARAPDDPALYEHLATAAYAAGRSSEALQNLLRVLLLTPDRSDVAQAAVALSGKLEGPACAFVLVQGRLGPPAGCPSMRNRVCGAATSLLRVLRAAPSGEASEPDARIAAIEHAAQVDFGCPAPLSRPGR